MFARIDVFEPGGQNVVPEADAPADQKRLCCTSANLSCDELFKGQDRDYPDIREPPGEKP